MELVELLLNPKEQDFDLITNCGSVEYPRT